MSTNALCHGHQSPASIMKKRKSPNPSWAKDSPLPGLAFIFFAITCFASFCWWHSGRGSWWWASHIQPEPSWENGSVMSSHKSPALTPNAQQGRGTSHLSKAPSTRRGTQGQRMPPKIRASSCWPLGLCSPPDPKAHAVHQLSSSQEEKMHAC